MGSKFNAIRWIVACAGLVVSAVGTGGYAAAPYPSRPVRLVVPFAPGGGADTLSRIIAPRLSEAMGQQWIVDNRSGAAGNLAAEIVANAVPDGHTVFMGFSTVLTVNPVLYRRGRSGNSSRLPSGNPAASITRRPASAVRCILPRNCSKSAPASTWCICPTRAAVLPRLLCSLARRR
jgi:hypothetical protein